MQPRYFKSGAEFRRWLEQNHDTSAELLVGFHKRSTGKGGITHQEALDQALCFGWIDGVRRSLGEESYTIRFTPRRRGSFWSVVNTKRVAELKKAGVMTTAGLHAFKRRDPAKSQLYSYEARSRGFNDELEAVFKAKRKAWEFFEAQPPGYRRVVSWWVMSAKCDDTRARRLATLISESAAGKRLPMLTPPPKSNERSN